MVFGKRLAGKKRSWAILLGALLVVTSLVLLPKTIESVVAYMYKQTDSVTNILEPAKVLVDVEESFDGQTKSNVSVRNHSDIPVYIRVTVVQYWKKDGGYVPQPDDGQVYIEMGSDDWLQSGDMYYYKSPVQVGAETADLINQVTAKMPEGYTYHLDIHAEAIQSNPARAAQESWGITVDSEGEILSIP